MGVRRALQFRKRVSDCPNRLLQPQVLLPTQQNHAGGTPEKRLLIAMLADAVNCFQRHGIARGPANRRAAHESEVWIMSRDRDWPFSFENVCEFLEIDASYVRTTLLKVARASADVRPAVWPDPAHRDRARAPQSVRGGGWRSGKMTGIARNICRHGGPKHGAPGCTADGPRARRAPGTGVGRWHF